MAISFNSGSVLLVPAGRYHALAVMTAKTPHIAFYSCRDEFDIADIGSLSANEPLFVIAVMKAAYSAGRWGQVLGQLRETAIPAAPPVFRQEIGSGACSIVEPGRSTRLLVPREECIGMERQAVWSAHHVESRLVDHYEGRPNIFVESLKVEL
ncbi:hypothetical protein [Actinoplanes palleronii]|uniref:Uncharacterized protein n=1 Tax=Actinoplanes palleronii TaxID=113570 RepID=A0ABQ4BTN0_9ACTN|nr:hypothetical protein [Actinoplanes palleronii]GIE74032.1 hypothetical protein Apa02nite_101400 [Actinoplanes palleronii]